jgi:hypothetical protein
VRIDSLDLAPITSHFHEMIIGAVAILTIFGERRQDVSIVGFGFCCSERACPFPRVEGAV